MIQPSQTLHTSPQKFLCVTLKMKQPLSYSLAKQFLSFVMSQSVSHSVVSNSLDPMDSKPTSLLSPRDFPDKSTGVGCHFLLQGIFPTQGSNPGLPHCGQILSPLTHYVYLPTKGISQFWMHLLPLNPCFPWFSSTAPMSGGCFAVLTGGIFISLWSFPPFGELNVCCLNSGKGGLHWKRSLFLALRNRKKDSCGETTRKVGQSWRDLWISSGSPDRGEGDWGTQELVHSTQGLVLCPHYQTRPSGRT